MTFIGQIAYLTAMFLIINHLWCGRNGDESGLDIARKHIWKFFRSERVKRFLEELGKPEKRQ